MGLFGIKKRIERALPPWWKVCLVKRVPGEGVRAQLVDVLAYSDTQAIEFAESYFGNGKFATLCNYCGDHVMYQEAIQSGDAEPLPAYDEEGNRLPWRHGRPPLQSEGYTRLGP